MSGKPLAAPRQHNPEISPEVEQVILQAMEVVASERYATVDEFRQALKDAYAASGGYSRRLIKEFAEPMDPGYATYATTSLPSIAKTPQPTYKSAVKIEWVEILEGEFLYGEDKQVVFLPRFRISRCPVTNQQYHYFLQANLRYPAPEHWKERNFPPRKE